MDLGAVDADVDAATKGALRFQRAGFGLRGPLCCRAI